MPAGWYEAVPLNWRLSLFDRRKLLLEGCLSRPELPEFHGVARPCSSALTDYYTINTGTHASEVKIMLIYLLLSRLNAWSSDMRFREQLENCKMNRRWNTRTHTGIELMQHHPAS